MPKGVVLLLAVVVVLVISTGTRVGDVAAQTMQPPGIAISLDRGPGATYYTGETMEICVTVASREYVRLADYSTTTSRTIVTAQLGRWAGGDAGGSDSGATDG